MAKHDVRGSEALEKFHELIDAPDRSMALQSMDFGKAVRNLTGPQQRALENLLVEFRAHPRTSSPGQYLVEAFNRSTVMNDNYVELDLVSYASRMHRIFHGTYLPQGES